MPRTRQTTPSAEVPPSPLGRAPLPRQEAALADVPSLFPSVPKLRCWIGCSARFTIRSRRAPVYGGEIHDALEILRLARESFQIFLVSSAYREIGGPNG